MIARLKLLVGGASMECIDLESRFKYGDVDTVQSQIEY